MVKGRKGQKILCSWKGTKEILMKVLGAVLWQEVLA